VGVRGAVRFRNREPIRPASRVRRPGILRRSHDRPNLTEKSNLRALGRLSKEKLPYFVVAAGTGVVIGFPFSITNDAIAFTVVAPLFIPSCTFPGSTKNESPAL